MSDGLTLVGNLHLPPEAGDHPAPAVVLTGPFTGVKEQVTGNYARRLAAAGFVALAFDHRNFGESAGEPRQHEDSAGRLADLRDAVSYLGMLPAVDARRIGACGICFGGGFALRLAAFDPRVKAGATVAGGYNDPTERRRRLGADLFRAQLARFAQLAQRQYETGEIVYLPAVAPAGQPAGMACQEPFDYYGTARSSSPGWVNRVTALSGREFFTLGNASPADFVSPTPLLVVHGRTDAFCLPEDAARVFERVGQPKDILWLETTNHIDLYDVEDFVGPAAARVATWFDEHFRRLAEPGAPRNRRRLDPAGSGRPIAAHPRRRLFSLPSPQHGLGGAPLVIPRATPWCAGAPGTAHRSTRETPPCGPASASGRLARGLRPGGAGRAARAAGDAEP